MGTRYNDICMHAYIGDHPHAYGDKSLSAKLLTPTRGSSPRVWGQDAKDSICRPNIGIIPTRMGTRISCCYNCALSWDHPHAYGDKVRLASPETSILGSSPRVWGQVVPLYYITGFSRIIPTRMGTSISVMRADDNVQDHPHAYGDKLSCCLSSLSKAGSSPRVWGQVSNDKNEVLIGRIIPTRMGTREKAREQKNYLKDHPHAYGDKNIQ